MSTAAAALFPSIFNRVVIFVLGSAWLGFPSDSCLQFIIFSLGFWPVDLQDIFSLFKFAVFII